MLHAQKPTAPTTARPPRDGLRTKSIAVLVPLASVAGALASRFARPSNLDPCAKRESRRSTSSGISAVSRPTTRIAPAIAAGTIVNPTGASPLRTPTRSSTPNTTSATM